MDHDTKSLEEWYADYMVESAWGNRDFFSCDTFKALSDDELDISLTERRIGELMPSIHITEGFCSVCQNSFDNWPNLIKPPSKPDRENCSAPRESTEFTVDVHSDSDSDSDSDSSEYGLGKPATRPCHKNTYALEASSRNGCRFCALLVQSMVDEDLLDIYRKIEERLCRLAKSVSLQISVQRWGGNGHSQNLWLNFPGKLCLDVNSSASHLTSSYVEASGKCPGVLTCNTCLYFSGTRHAKQLTTPVLDPLSVAKDWLTTCCSSHGPCNLNDATVLPSRLLSIATDPPRLVLTAEWTTKPQYATLCHCWGDQEFFKLRPDNLDLLIKMIPMYELPKTFTDAIDITRKLGLDYLWIDSICIIQGDNCDWEHESALMSPVYGGSSVNIAASSARDGSQGCFLKPKYFTGGFLAEISIKGSRKVYDFRSPLTYDKATVNSHLATRAWAFQEKLLAPRTLHCGDQGLFWE
jgi:hypothetical protein